MTTFDYYRNICTMLVSLVGVYWITSFLAEELFHFLERFSINRQGTTRIVILTNRHAIKLPNPRHWKLFLLGLLANMQERKFWETKWPELCPVLFSLPGGWLVVMPRVKVMTREEWDYFAVKTFSEKDGYTVPVDPKYMNFGHYKGRIVAIDYGS